MEKMELSYLASFFVLEIIFFLDKQQGIGGANASNRLGLHSCNKIVRLQTNESLKELFGEKKKQRVSLNIALKRKNSEKGCAQDTYNPSALYSECGIDNVIPMLPTHNALPVLYVKRIPRKTSQKGGLDYIFDGGTAVRYPTKQLPAYWFQKYTISGWIRPEIHGDRQYLIYWSDGDTARQENTGFYIARRPGVDHMLFGFHHKHKDASSADECLIKEKWKLKVDEHMHWHFFTLSFKKCSVELTVDGKYLSPTGVGFTFRMPGKHIQPKFVVGARWAGSVSKYSEYFHGSISGLMMKYGDILKITSLNCLLRCKEKLELSTKLPSGLQEEGLENGGHLIIEGKAEQRLFENLINDIIYINDNEYPDKGSRTISIMMANKETKKVLKQEIDVDIQRPSSSVSIQGNCGKQDDANLFFKQGMKLCPYLKITLRGCLQFIDLITVAVHPELSKKEKIFIPSAYLKRHQITLFNTDNGFVLYGESSINHYMEVLSQMKYLFNGILNGDLSRTITITASSHNGLIESNGFVITLKANTDSVHITPNSHNIKSGNPSDNYINLIKAEPGEPIIYSQEKKKLAMQTNKSSQSYIGWMALACGFSVIVILFMIGYGVRKHNRRVSLHNQYFLHEHNTINQHSLIDQPSMVSLPRSSDCVSPDFYWDEEGLSMRLIINPSERISIINDPYSELLLKQRRSEETLSATEGSVYSEEDLSDFDTDSIRQLEWDCLEDNLDQILQEDKLIKEIREGKRKKEDLCQEVFL